MLTDTTHDDGRQPIAISHLSDSGDLKIKQEVHTCNVSVLHPLEKNPLYSRMNWLMAQLKARDPKTFRKSSPKALSLI